MWGAQLRTPRGSPAWARIPPPRYGRGFRTRGSVPFTYQKPENTIKNMGAFFFGKVIKNTGIKIL